MKRRDFLKMTSTLLALPLFAKVFAAESAHAQGRRGQNAGGEFVDPKSPQAVGVKYVEKHADLKDAALKIDRQGVKFAQQSCANCGLYQKKDGQSGTCAIFPGKMVKANSWCQSWNKKA